MRCASDPIKSTKPHESIRRETSILSSPNIPAGEPALIWNMISISDNLFKELISSRTKSYLSGWAIIGTIPNDFKYLHQDTTSSSDENSFKIIVFSPNALSKEVIVKYSVDAENGEIYYEIYGDDGIYDYATEQFNITSFINENFTFNFNNYGNLYSSNDQTLNYSIKSGNFPAGLTFSNGQINGTPTSTFTGSITIEIAAYKCDSKSYQINLNFINCVNGVDFKTNDLEIKNSKFENCIGQVVNILNLKNALIYNTKFIIQKDQIYPNLDLVYV